MAKFDAWCLVILISWPLLCIATKRAARFKADYEHTQAEWNKSITTVAHQE